MQSAAELLRRSRKILLSGHLRADGDCLGAQVVLFHALRELGKEVQILLPDLPDSRYGFLEAHTPWKIWEGTLPEADLLVVCDCNQISRLGVMGEAVVAAGLPRIAVDHHVLEPGQGWTALVHDVGAAASGTLALRFVEEEFGLRELPIEAYEAAFVALMTDTGWLKYSNASPEAWAAAAALVARGLETSELHALIYQQAEPGRPAGVRVALENLEYLQDGRIALSWTGDEALARSGGSMEDTDEVLDLLRAVGRVEAVGLVSERSDGRVKVSFRSKRLLDVHRVARGLGGGGHARASGASFAPEVGLAQAVLITRSALLAGWKEQGLK